MFVSIFFFIFSFHCQQPNNFENEKELKDEKDDPEFDVMRKNIREAWNDFKKKVDKKVKEILDYIKAKEMKKKFDKCSKVCINDMTYL